MNSLVVAAAMQLIGLVVIISSVFMLLLTYGSGGAFWLYLLFFGVFVTVSTFLYLGSKERRSR